MNNILDSQKVINEVFRKNKVVLAFLFGSLARGKANKQSDFDFGVVLSKNIPPAKYHQVRVTLLDQIGRLIKTRPVDVAILNEALPLLTQLVMTQGKLIYCRDENLKIDFQTNALKKFDDALYLRKTYYYYLGQRIKENRLGEIYAKK